MTLTRHKLAAAAAIAFVSGPCAALAQDTILTVESWRDGDATAWQETIIPAFEAANPGIKVTFAPTADGSYDSALAARLESGSAGDLIACRPFDTTLYENGNLAALALPGMEDLPALSRAAWSTDDGATAFCVPIGAATQGFIYNKEIFEKLGLSAPETVAEFHVVIDTLRDDGRFIPLAMGIADQWEAATVGYQNIGPTYWRGEEGRLSLIAGEQKLTDENWVAPYRELARWRDYLGDGFTAQTYSDSQNLFTLGRAAIYPAGSWEIAGFTANANFEMGAFPPPVLNAGDRCMVTIQPEIGIGVNAESPNLDAAKAFLNFIASGAFATAAASASPGMFPFIGRAQPTDPLAREFASWLSECETTLPSTVGPLSRGMPSLEEESRKAAAQVIKGAETPETVAARLQAGLDGWYKPAQ